MELCRLKSIAFFLLLIFTLISCLENSIESDFYKYEKKYHYTYSGQERRLGKKDASTLILKKDRNKENAYYKVITENDKSITLDSFFMENQGNVLLYKKSGCEETDTIVLAKRQEKTDIIWIKDSINFVNCASYPFLFNEISLPQKMTVEVDKKQYTIFKISSKKAFTETYSSIFWLEGFGIILINLKDGFYYELKSTNQVKIPWEKILREVKKEVDFTELYVIPPPPPPPPPISIEDPDSI